MLYIEDVNLNINYSHFNIISRVMVVKFLIFKFNFELIHSIIMYSVIFNSYIIKCVNHYDLM